MRLRWKAVTLFSTGVIFGSLCSFVGLLMLLDLHGQTRGSVGWYDVVSRDFLHHRLETARDAERRVVRIVCWVLTTVEHHKTKAWAVRNTWGRRCDHLLFVSSGDDPQLGAVQVRVKRGRDHLWDKTKAGLRLVHERFAERGDWFLKADDDTYVIVDNLRHMLATKNSSDLVYLGYRFKKYIPQGYMSGGAGYVLSGPALRRLVEVGLKRGSPCTGRVAEDLALGDCLYKVGIPAGDSRDSLGRERFFPLPLQQFVSPFQEHVSDWIWRFTYYGMRPGLDCCSDTAISFHYLTPEDLYAFEYMIYYLRVRRSSDHALGRSERVLAPPPSASGRPTKAAPPTSASAPIKESRNRTSRHRPRPLTRPPLGGSSGVTFLG